MKPQKKRGTMARWVMMALIMCLPATAIAQDTIDVALGARQISADSTEVTLNIGALGDSLAAGIWAFEFHVETADHLTYLGINSTATLSAKEGWTTAANVENKWAGGFSSSTRAIEHGGTLLALYFATKDAKKGDEVCLKDLRLNSGSPKPSSNKLCVGLFK